MFPLGGSPLTASFLLFLHDCESSHYAHNRFIILFWIIPAGINSASFSHLGVPITWTKPPKNQGWSQHPKGGGKMTKYRCKITHCPLKSDHNLLKDGLELVFDSIPQLFLEKNRFLNPPERCRTASAWPRLGCHCFGGYLLLRIKLYI